MQKSHAIARLAGPVFAAIGIGMLANEGAYREIAAQFLSASPFVYFSGVLMLLGGLTILNSHHDWTPDWRSAITLLGWVMAGIGVFRIIAPPFVPFIAGALVANSEFFVVTGILLLGVGGFLTFKGYVA